MLYYFQIDHGNFGDELNPWLWSKLAPELCDASDPRLFLAIGTILDARVPREPRKFVFGSGCAPEAEVAIDERWKFYAVRGPRTAAKLGLVPECAVADPAILIRQLAAPRPAAQYPAAFMPHHQSTLSADWQRLCAEAGIHFLDPRKSVDEVLPELLRTELLLTEAMHGAIVADALRVPWIAVRLYPQFVEFKWRDWAESLGIDLRLHDVPPIFESDFRQGKTWLQAVKRSVANLGVGKAKWKRYSVGATSKKHRTATLEQLRALAKNVQPQLSLESKLKSAESRLGEILQALRADWRNGTRS